MLIKWINFAIIGHLISVVASKQIKDLDIEDVSKSKTSCIDGKCFLVSEVKNQVSTEETNTPKQDATTHKEEDELQPNAFDVVKLLSLLANYENKGKNKISFSVRDIQSGFHNDGSKYHVGNIHREQNRDKRDIESVLEDTITNEDNKFGLALTTKTSTYDVQTEEDNSKDLVIQSTTVNYQANNDNKSVDVNVAHAEADNFQDSNVIINNDSVANDSTTASIDNNVETDLKMGVNGSDVQVLSTVPSDVDSNDNSNNNIIDINAHSILNDSYNTSTTESDVLGTENELANEAKVINESYLQSPNNQSQLPKVKIALSKKDLNNIQNALSDDLGVKSEDATSVANFSLNDPVGKDEKNPVIVLVYNCSCANKDTHTHDNATHQGVVGIDDNNINNANVLDTRRMLSNDEPVFFSLETEVTSEVTIPEDELKVYATRKADDETSNSLLENELLQKCNSLLSLQQTNKANENLDTILDTVGEEGVSLNQANVNMTQNISSVISDKNDNYYNDTQVSQNNDSDSSIIAESFETENNSVTFYNDATVKTTPVDNNSSNSQLPINNVANDSQTDSNTGIVDQAVTLISDKLNTAVNNEALNLDTVVKETLISKRKRRSLTKDSNNSKDGVNKSIKSSRHPKYYDYTNDGKNLLQPDSKSNENDGTIVNFKSLNEDAAVIDDGNIEAVKQNNNFNMLDLYKDILPSHDRDIAMNEVLKLLGIKPIYINVYLQLLLKNLGQDKEIDN